MVNKQEFWDSVPPGLFKQIAEIGSCIWQRGWAEANAGNVSIRLDDAPDAELFLVSRTGSRYRQFAQDPMQSLMLVHATQDGWKALDPQCKPSSEINAHLNIHRHLKSINSPARVILHSHPNPVIAISHHKIFQDEERLNQELAEMLPEFPLFLPKGTSLCELYPPGSEELANASYQCLGERNAIIWKHHGLLCMGHSLDQAFDYMEVIVKACEIWLMLRAPQAPPA